MPEERHEGAADEDAQFGQRAVERGFVTQEQVKQAAAARQTILQVGLTKSLAEIMVEKGLMTKAQSDIVQREVESGGKIKFIGQYELIAKLGEGGMGVVYKALDPSLDRLVALKVLPPNLAKDEKFVARFQREARMAARLDHVNIVSALAVGEAEGHHYFAMEFVEGRTVGEILEQKGAMGEEEAISIIMQVTRALKHAWEHQLIHRDIKPDNILVTKQGVAKLADLGLARSTASDSTRMTQTGTAMGTPYYISPEQARGEKDIDIRTDIYSLGVTLYHMLTGEVPFQGSTAAVVITKRLTDDPPKAHDRNPSISENTSRVIERMMARDREMRYSDPGNLLNDLELVADGKAPETASQMTLMGDSADLIEKDLARLKETRAIAVGAPSRKLLIGAISGVVVLLVVIAGVLVVVLGKGRPFAGPETAVEIPLVPAVPPAAATGDQKLAMLEREAAGQLKAITNLVREGEERAALTLAKPARGKYADTRYGPDFEALVNQLELRLAMGATGTPKKDRDEEKKKREKLAEAEYAKATTKMGAGELDEAVAVAKRAAGDYADTSWGEKLAELERDLAAKLAEEKGLAEEKAKEEAEKRQLEQLVRRGDAALAAERFDDALAAYGSALEMENSPELRKKMEEVNFSKAAASALALERDGNLDQAIALYVKALEIRDDERVRGKIKELNELNKFRDQLARAEAAEEAGDIGRAISAYAAALRLAPEEESARVSAKIRQLEKAGRYDEFISAARSSAAAMDWQNASAWAEKAVSVRPDDAEAKVILSKAKSRLSLPPQIENSLGMKLILVRAGAFRMGSETGEADERPEREVFVDDCYISETEVTNVQYESFDPSHASKRKPFSPADDCPAVLVSWEQAMGFCRVLGSRESRTYRLPTEAEWERAARGTDGRSYPWGNSPAEDGRSYRLRLGPGEWTKTGKKDGYPYCSPAKSYAGGVSPVGCYDMAGNVWEWCLDWYSDGYYARAPKENPAGPAAGAKKVLRGGAFSNDLSCARVANRHGAPPGRADANIGFRVVLVVE